MILVLVVIAVLSFWAAAISVAHAIGKPKHRSGFRWGFFLGWLGVLVVALLPPAEKTVTTPLPDKGLRMQRLVTGRWETFYKKETVD